MSTRYKVILAGISIAVLIVVLFVVKYPPGRISKHQSPEAEVKEPTNNILNTPSTVPSTPEVTSDSGAKQQMFKFPEGGIPVLMYHSISTIPGNSLGVPVKQFTGEMEWLHQQKYNSLSIDGFYNILANKASVPEKPILITFDDGYADNYTEAWPILQKNGFNATFFIITSSVGPKTITWDNLAELVRQGNSIGSHTVNHFDLSKLTAAQQEDELRSSKQELESRLGINVQAFCFPSGRYNETTLDLLPKLGYKLAFTTKPGRVILGDNLLTLKRVRISGGMSITSFQKLFP